MLDIRSFKIMDLTKASGLDSIPTVVLNKCTFQVATHLTILFFSSFRKRKVHPFPQACNPCRTANYRPISSLSTLGKAVERHINHSEMSFCMIVNMVSRYKGLLLIALFQCWRDSLDDGSEVWTVAHDISKAFDKVWHW
jgi:hypothetical protein